MKKSNIKLGEMFDNAIYEKVNEILKENKFPEYDDIYSDTFSELIDKLIIVHIRYWYLEDAMANARNDEELIRYRKKSESLFKEKRPKLVESIDKIFINLLTKKIEYNPINTKKYENWGEEKK
jgi:hypothetical protein